MSKATYNLEQRDYTKYPIRISKAICPISQTKSVNYMKKYYSTSYLPTNVVA